VFDLKLNGLEISIFVSVWGYLEYLKVYFSKLIFVINPELWLEIFGLLCVIDAHKYN